MHIHILGICGTFMGGIALIAKAMGHEVSGSDANVYPPMSTQLEDAGIQVLDLGQIDAGIVTHVGDVETGGPASHNVAIDTEREHMMTALEIHERVTGARPRGWYLGRCSPNSHRLAAEQREATGALKDISFDTISGSCPNGSIIHYRVSEASDRTMRKGELFLVDSGGQYLDGTTDITRTIALGDQPDERKDRFTRVLQGHIALASAVFPPDTSGYQLDILARRPLWNAGLDYAHGTGHGVGTYLGVHEGPQSVAKKAPWVPLRPGMILSNEPGYYREGAFGIRIENLIVVREAPKIAGADDRDQLAFETLTWVPIDTRLVDPALLSPGEREWLNAYHAEVREKIAPRVSDAAARWLEAATRAI